MLCEEYSMLLILLICSHAILELLKNIGFRVSVLLMYQCCASLSIFGSCSPFCKSPTVWQTAHHFRIKIMSLGVQPLYQQYVQLLATNPKWSIGLYKRQVLNSPFHHLGYSMQITKTLINTLLSCQSNDCLILNLMIDLHK